MDILKRLFRKPVTTLLWLLFVLVMTGALTLGSALTFSSEKLAKQLDSSHTAIAVRTDPAADPLAARDNEDYDVLSIRSFTKEDAAYFEGLDTVKAVRSNTLSAACSPSFRPLFECRSAVSWRARGPLEPYYNAVFVGMPVEISLSGDYLVIEVVLRDALLLNEELMQAKNVINNFGGFYAVMDISDCPQARDGIKLNEWCVFCGMFNPAWISVDRSKVAGALSLHMASYILHLGRVTYEDGRLWGHDFDNGAPFPAYEPLPEDTEDFFENAPDVWREYRDAWKKQNSGLPVIGTDRLESMFCFVHGDAVISEGRSFTPEEYELGARSVIISDLIAQRGGINLGDKLSLRQYLCPDAVLLGYRNRTVETSLNNPRIGNMDYRREYAEEEEFTVVGIYHLAAIWASGTYSIDPNTVFIPRAAQIPGAFGGIGDTNDIYGIHLSIELKNGSVDDFQLQLASSRYAGQFYTFDQGYEAVQKKLNDYAASSRRLMMISVIGWVLFLLLYLLMYQSAQKHNLGVMRSLGNLPRQVLGYHFGSGAVVVLAGVAAGTAISGFALKIIQGRVLADALSGIDRTALGGTAIPEEVLTEMVKSSQPGIVHLAVFAAIQFVLISIPMLIQSFVLSRQLPRDLLRK